MNTVITDERYVYVRYILGIIILIINSGFVIADFVIKPWVNGRPVLFTVILYIYWVVGILSSVCMIRNWKRFKLNYLSLYSYAIMVFCIVFSNNPYLFQYKPEADSLILAWSVMGIFRPIVMIADIHMVRKLNEITIIYSPTKIT